jgi:hypothetical protein
MSGRAIVPAGVLSKPLLNLAKRIANRDGNSGSVSKKDLAGTGVKNVPDQDGNGTISSHDLAMRLLFNASSQQNGPYFITVDNEKWHIGRDGIAKKSGNAAPANKTEGKGGAAATGDKITMVYDNLSKLGPRGHTPRRALAMAWLRERWGDTPDAKIRMDGKDVKDFIFYLYGVPRDEQTKVGIDAAFCNQDGKLNDGDSHDLNSFLVRSKKLALVMPGYKEKTGINLGGLVCAKKVFFIPVRLLRTLSDPKFLSKLLGNSAFLSYLLNQGWLDGIGRAYVEAGKSKGLDETKLSKFFGRIKKKALAYYKARKGGKTAKNAKELAKKKKAIIKLFKEDRVNLGMALAGYVLGAFDAHAQQHNYELKGSLGVKNGIDYGRRFFDGIVLAFLTGDKMPKSGTPDREKEITHDVIDKWYDMMQAKPQQPKNKKPKTHASYNNK